MFKLPPKRIRKAAKNYLQRSKAEENSQQVHIILSTL